MRVWVAGPEEADTLRPRLAEILIDCVRLGAPVGFLGPGAAEMWLRG